jgi:conjugal transfer mating pair stabilization protein TraN
VFCVGTSCFNMTTLADGDFARSMTMLEAGRQAALYMDPDTLQVFSGDPARCRDRLLVDCCDGDSAGRGMTNQSALGLGTKLVYDVLFNSSNRDFVLSGIQGFLAGTGAIAAVGEGYVASNTLSLSAYGFKVLFTETTVGVSAGGAGAGTGSLGSMSIDAALGTAEAFSATQHATAVGESVSLYNYGTASGGQFTLALDPWSLAISVAVAVVVSSLSCNEREALTAMKEGARLCHTIGRWCSSDSIFGCLTRTYGKCCFNSMIARIINQQGRAQLGRSWGTARAPDCSGFTLSELNRLNFGTMDFAEFYDSIVPNSISFTDAQNRALTTPSNCYFGQGRCQ